MEIQTDTRFSTGDLMTFNVYYRGERVAPEYKDSCLIAVVRADSADHACEFICNTRAVSRMDISAERLLGRPKELQGDYVTLSLAIRKDLLAKIDASGKSRRQYIEDLLQHFDEVLAQ